MSKNRVNEDKSASCGMSEKLAQLDCYKVCHDPSSMTTDQGVGVYNDQTIIKAGERGPALLQDFVFREKVMHFDHERIPERVVHARGFGAHGVFRVYEDMSDITCAKFLCDPDKETPVFVRFSTVVGFRGSPDTVRDVRGFATKFYTEEGNYDLVGNNMPVFFIQDAIKFPDLVHALKPEPHNEIPQAQSAHDTFWDFVANNHETAHNVMWLMSDRAIPRSFRTMDGFGIHTFKLVNSEGVARLVKFHWKSLQGVHSMVWDETQRVAGKDPDFNRRDLWEAIENGNYPEWELGIQVMEECQQHDFDFDVLDSTKLWPEELFPVKRIGRMTLNRNVTNFFAETEQVAFCPANLVPGIDLTNDPMLQGRLFSYLDTQLSRLGGPNFHEIPINRPIVPVHNNQRDGMHRMTIDKGIAAYAINAIGNGQPHLATAKESYFRHHSDRVEGEVTRDVAEKFADFYTQPAMFWNSMSAPERQHIVDAFRFELGKCKRSSVRQAVVDMLNMIDGYLAEQVAVGIGSHVPAVLGENAALGKASPALSMACQPNCPVGRKVAVLIDEGVDKANFDSVTCALTKAGACVVVVAPKQGGVNATDGTVNAAETYQTTASVLYDAIFIPNGVSAPLMLNGMALQFIAEAYKHYKPIIACGDAIDLITAGGVTDVKVAGEEGALVECEGVLTMRASKVGNNFNSRAVALVGGMRHFERGAKVESVIA